MDDMKPRFQLHLSTCLVLMFVAGAIIWLNLRAVRTDQLDISASEVNRIFNHGWPCIAWTSTRPCATEKPVLYRGIAVNVLVGLAILAAVAVGCELLQRRRLLRSTLSQPAANPSP